MHLVHNRGFTALPFNTEEHHSLKKKSVRTSLYI